MSGQSSQWVRKSSPSSKQGPMKATLPMSSLTRQNSNLIQSQNNSPTLSPTSSWKSRTSPDPSLSGLRSPGAVNYRGRDTWNKKIVNIFNICICTHTIAIKVNIF